MTALPGIDMLLYWTVGPTLRKREANKKEGGRVHEETEKGNEEAVMQHVRKEHTRVLPFTLILPVSRLLLLKFPVTTLKLRLF